MAGSKKPILRGLVKLLEAIKNPRQFGRDSQHIGAACPHVVVECGGDFR
jgi:hypothetical protein